VLPAPQCYAAPGDLSNEKTISLANPRCKGDAILKNWELFVNGYVHYTTDYLFKKYVKNSGTLA
jgi:hypothetical protein